MWNRRYYYREKIKKAACWALIIILLPYIVTVFVNGPKIVTASKVDEMTIDVKGGGKMPVEKYCIGILARDMPAEYEEEALKAQAILCGQKFTGQSGMRGKDRSLRKNSGPRNR